MAHESEFQLSPEDVMALAQADLLRLQHERQELETPMGDPQTGREKDHRAARLAEQLARITYLEARLAMLEVRNSHQNAIHDTRTLLGVARSDFRQMRRAGGFSRLVDRLAGGRDKARKWMPVRKTVRGTFDRRGR